MPDESFRSCVECGGYEENCTCYSCSGSCGSRICICYEEHYCDSYDCRHRGTPNSSIEYRSGMIRNVFLCLEHINHTSIDLCGGTCCTARNITKKKKTPAHQCNLILCKECLSNVRELLSF